MVLEEEHFWNNVIPVVCMKGLNWGGTKSFNFPSNRNAMKTNCIGDVTLREQYNSFRSIFTVAPLSSGCTSKSEKIK